MKAATLSLNEIERYWGSLEAYNEEQRRVGLTQLEAEQFNNFATFDFKPNLVSNLSQGTITRRHSGQQNGFHLFGHKA